MSGSDVEVGVLLLEYADRITEIIGKLSDALQSAQTAADMFARADFYQGQAQPEMEMFFQSYAANIDKLSFFEMAAQQFLGQVFSEFITTDEELAAVLASFLDGS